MTGETDEASLCVSLSSAKADEEVLFRPLTPCLLRPSPSLSQFQQKGEMGAIGSRALTKKSALILRTRVDVNVEMMSKQASKEAGLAAL